MSYRIKEGRRLIGINMAQIVYSPGIWAHIFIDCPACDQSIGLYFSSNAESDAFSNKEFLQIVRSRGWAVIPNKHIACPSCRKVRSNPTKRAADSTNAARLSNKKRSQSKNVAPAISG